MKARQRGSIHARGDDCFDVVIDLPRKKGERRRRIWKRVRGTLQDAESALKKLVDNRASRHVLSGKETLGTYLERWLEHVADRETVRPATIARYRQLLELHVVPRIGLYTLNELVDEPELIERTYSRARREGNGRKKGAPLKGRTVLHVHRVLYGALKQALKWKLILTNPCEAVTPPAAKRVEMRTLQADEVRQLISTSEGTRLHAPIVLTVSVGFRRGEVLGLTWGCVDFERSTIRVSRSLQPDGQLVEPKTERSRRIVKVPTFAMDVLRQHRAEQAQRRLVSGGAYRDRDLVFTDLSGGPWKPASIATLFRAIAERAGLGHLRFHDLRHTAASLMIARGVPVTTVAAVLGHANTSTTLAVYAHTVREAEDTAARVMEGVLQGVGSVR